MVELMVLVVSIALVGSIGVPVVVLTLARLGYFEPIQLRVLGREWNFAPPGSLAGPVSFSNSSILEFPGPSRAFAFSVTSMTFSPKHATLLVDPNLTTGAAFSGQIRAVRKAA